MSNIVTTMLPPFSMVPIPKYVRNELERRATTQYGLQFTAQNTSNTSYDSNYKGPMTTWMRVASNIKLKDGNGFILYGGGQGANQAYGIGKYRDLNNNLQSNNQILGYDFDGRPHILNYSNYNSGNITQFHRPIPGVESISVEIAKDVYRRSKITWKCYSLDQLNYMARYFFVPYSTIILEFGWNNFDSTSLIDIFNIGTQSPYDLSGSIVIADADGNPTGTGVLGAYTNPLLIEESLVKSNGNYDAQIGHVVDYSYSFNESDLSYTCITEIAGNSKFYFALATTTITRANKIKDSNDDDSDTKDVKYMSLQKYFTEKFKDDITYDYYGELGGEPALLGDYLGNLLEFTSTKAKKRQKTVRLSGRIFIPLRFEKKHLQGMTYSQGNSKYSDVTYVRFDLFIEALNAFLAANNYIMQIDISNTIIGAHPNIISPSMDFLIPNSYAPWFDAYFLSELSDSDINTLKIYKPDTTEMPAISSSYSGKANSDGIVPENYILTKLFNKTYRQNLNTVINYDLKSPFNNIIDQSFPSKNNPFAGYLKNIYFKLDVLIDAVKSQKDLRGILTSLCETLNKAIPIWKLEPVIDNQLVTIIDDRYNDFSTLEKNSSIIGFGLTSSDSPVYMFDVISQNSLVKNYGMEMKLSADIASMLINQTNSELGGANQIQNTQVSLSDFHKVHDRVLDGIIIKSIPVNNNNSLTPEAKSSPDDLSKRLQTVNDNCICFMKKGTKTYHTRFTPTTLTGESPSSVNAISIPTLQSIRLNLPDDRNDVLQTLINTRNDNYVNINNMPIPGLTVSFSLLGISGLKMFQIFSVNSLAKPYNGTCALRLSGLKHTISAEGWITEVEANICPTKALDQVILDNAKPMNNIQ